MKISCEYWPAENKFDPERFDFADLAASRMTGASLDVYPDSCTIGFVLPVKSATGGVRQHVEALLEAAKANHIIWSGCVDHIEVKTYGDNSEAIVQLRTKSPDNFLPVLAALGQDINDTKSFYPALIDGQDLVDLSRVHLQAQAQAAHQRVASAMVADNTAARSFSLTNSGKDMDLSRSLGGSFLKMETSASVFDPRESVVTDICLSSAAAGTALAALLQQQGVRAQVLEYKELEDLAQYKNPDGWSGGKTLAEAERIQRSSVRIDGDIGQTVQALNAARVMPDALANEIKTSLEAVRDNAAPAASKPAVSAPAYS